MSAAEDYREAREGSIYRVTAMTITMKADAAIAELEAALTYKTEHADTLHKAWEQAEAEVSALTARHCEDCGLVAKWKDAADMRNEDCIVLEVERDKYRGMLQLFVDDDFGYVPESVKSDALIADLERRWDELN